MTRSPGAGAPCPPPSVERLRTAREHAGLAVEGPFSILELAGADAAAFLQSQIPADVAVLDPGGGVYTARLERRGRVRFDLLLLRLEDRFWLVVRRELLGRLVEDLERYHFAEDLAFRDRGADLRVLEFHGPSAPELLDRASGSRLPWETGQHAPVVLAEAPCRFAAHRWTGEIGGHLIVPRDAVEPIVEALRGAGAEEPALLTAEDLEVLRIEGGHPRIGVDTDERTLLPELGREDMVSYTKGCYLGQETVARVHARGQVHRRLLGLVVEGDAVPGAGSLLMREGQPVGEVRSASRSPVMGCVVALAMVRVREAGPGDTVHVKHGPALVAAEIRELPLWVRPGPAEQARRLHRLGMEAFAGDRYEEALRHFEKATFMNPSAVESYEAIGVVHERQGRLDEAVEVMEELSVLDPENPMVWTNLSRYYAKLGRIEDAEAAKGKSLQLSWKREMGEAAARKKSEEEAEAARRRQAEREALFREVLELDPEDVVANFGLGKILLDLGRHGEAEPLFRKAIERQEDYSMAYNHLGACLIARGRTGEAAGVLRRGIEVAGRRGDLVPRREMMRRLEELGE